MKIKFGLSLIFVYTRTVLSTFMLPSLKALVLFEGLVFSLKVGRYILCDPTDNFATSGTSRICYSANAEQLPWLKLRCLGAKAAKLPR